MPIIQFQNGSLMTSIPVEVKNLLDLKKGETINFNISKNGKIEVIKIGQDLDVIKVICTKAFLIDKCDDDGFTIENKYFTVDKGQIWTIDNEKRNNFIGREIRLTRNSKGCTWIEISKERFEKYFEIIKEESK